VNRRQFLLGTTAAIAAAGLPLLPKGREISCATYWNAAEKAAVVYADQPQTIFFYESTAQGFNSFYDLWQQSKIAAPAWETGWGEHELWQRISDGKLFADSRCRTPIGYDSGVRHWGDST